MNIINILKYYWQIVKEYKLSFYVLTISYAIAAFLSFTVSPLIFKKIIDLISNTYDLSNFDSSILFKFILLFSINVLLYNVFFRIGDFLIVSFEAKSMKKISYFSFKKISNHSYSFFTNNFSGALIAKSRRFVSSFESLTDILVIEFLFSFIRITTSFIVLFYYSTTIGFIFLFSFISFFSIVFIFLKKKIKLDLINSQADSRTTGILSDLITNIFNIKFFSSGKSELKTYNEVLEYHKVARLKSWNFSNYQLMFQGFFLAITQILVIYFSAKLWMKGEISTGTVVLIYTYLLILFDVFWTISRKLGKFITHISDAKEMVDIFDKPLDILDPENPEKLIEGKGEIEFKNVDFEYVDNNEVFNNLNLKIKAGEKVGLVGHSGSGKSTITKMLLRFIDIKKGEILIDGQDIRKITQDDLRSKISYVPQEPILFHRSIGENIGYSKDNATKEEIIESAKKAHADEFISKLQNGYDTLVGERGVKLSGGERQRVAIARAMLKDSPILVLDEATSALDSVSESYIKEALNILMQNKTAIVIAHRLSTISKMDRIIVLDKGKIIEEGKHEELIAKNGAYAKLWNYQTGFLNEE